MLSFSSKIFERVVDMDRLIGEDTNVIARACSKCDLV
jgi:hypothetical protein